MKHKQKIPLELDELLWIAAESENPDTRKDFERRYPHLRAALATRRAMVEALRNSKPNAFEEFRLSFRKPVQKRPIHTWRLVAIPAILLLLFALGFGAYLATIQLQPSPGKEEAKTPQPEMQVAPERSETKKGLEPILIPHEDTAHAPKMEYEQLQPASPPSQRIQSNVPLVVLQQGETTLLDLLTTISNQTKKTFELLPGVKNVRIKVRSVLEDGKPVPINEVLAMIERAAPVRILDNGEEGYLVFPEEMVNSSP